MQVCPATGKLRLARATPYFNNIAPETKEGASNAQHLTTSVFLIQ
jgi:hypothetical protein